MRKFLSVKNTEGIYISRATISSEETIIDFCKSTSSNDNNNNNSRSTDAILNSDEPDVAKLKSAKKKRRLESVLKALHLKQKSVTKPNSEQMSESKGESVASGSNEKGENTSSSYTLSVPQFGRSKSRTASLVKKFSMGKKTPTSTKKSGIPVRTASIESISNATAPSAGTSSALRRQTPEGALTTTTTTATATLSLSEINLVNIDYRQQSGSGDNLNVGVKVGRTTTNRDNDVSSGFHRSGSGGIVRNSGSTDQLKIIISGKKRNSTELLTANTNNRNINEGEPIETYQAEPMRRLNNKSLRQQQEIVQQFSHNYELNTIDVNRTPSTQTQSIPCRPSDGNLTNAIQTRSSKQVTILRPPIIRLSERGITVDSPPASPAKITVAANIERENIPKIIAMEEESNNTSLLSEIIEAERRNSTARSENGDSSEQMSQESQPNSNVNEQAIVVTPIEATTTTADNDATQQRVTETEKEEDTEKADMMIATTTTTITEVKDDNSSQPTCQPSIHFEVGTKVRPTNTTNIHRNFNLNKKYSFSEIDNENTNDSNLVLLSSRADNNSYSLDTNHSLDSMNSADNIILNLEPKTKDTTTTSLNDGEEGAVATTSTSLSSSSLPARHRRRKIAYIAQHTSTFSTAADSNSIKEDTGEHDTTDAANSDTLSSGHQFNTSLDQLSNQNNYSVFTSDLSMPPYGDLVWSEDGVKR